MGRVTRKRHTAEFKARVALEAITAEQTPGFLRSLRPLSVAGRQEPARILLAQEMDRADATPRVRQ